MSLFFKIKKLSAIIYISIKKKNFRGLSSLFEGVGAGVDHFPITEKIRSLNTVIDIGANNGQFALFIDLFYKEAEIFCFEPLDSASQKINKIFQDKENLHNYKLAISNVKAELQINISNRNDSSSLLVPTKKQTIIFPGTDILNKAIIKTDNLSNIIQKSDISQPALLKIDVQGYELKVLEGCKDLIDRFEWVYIECSFLELYQGQALISDIINFLFNLNFELSGIYNLYYDNKSPIQGDFLFKKK